MQCYRCHSSRLVYLSAKTGSSLHLDHGQTRVEYSGDTPPCFLTDINNPGWEDYLWFTICLDCGQIQGSFPAPPLAELGEPNADPQLFAAWMKLIQDKSSEQIREMMQQWRQIHDAQQ